MVASMSPETSRPTLGRRFRKPPLHRSSSAEANRARSELELRTLQAFRTIFASARAHDAEIRRAAGISGSQLWALAEIANGRGLSVNRLAQRMALHQTTASNLLSALVDRKLIRRSRDASDQRVVRLTVTAAGQALLLRAPGPYQGLLVDALRQIDDRHLPRLLRSLAGLVAVLRRPLSAAAGETLLGE